MRDPAAEETARHLTVCEAGPLTTVQDGGRPGWAHLGVPRSGALDGPALQMANRLVGNAAEDAGLETTLGGVSLEVAAAMTVAVTGAVADVEVDGRAVAWGEPVSVRAGERLRVGPARSGLRSYVAVSGGIDADPVLGSRSTDTLAGLGPAVLSDGDRLAVGPPTAPPRGVDTPVVRRDEDSPLRFRAGPRDDWFEPAALATLTGSTYTVSAESNRVGLRLAGPPLARRVTAELPSEGIVLGAIQVPASGQPVVFLHDHPVTGGYPVVGVLSAADVTRCAQLRPGDEVRLQDCR